MAATPADKTDVDALWDQHNTLRNEHQKLHIEHVGLKGEVVAIRQNIDTVGRMIEDNRAARDAQHAELMSSHRSLSGKIEKLKTEEDKRDGMVRLGKYAAAILGGLGVLITAAYTLYKLLKGM